jgi:hypothetical protein
MVFSTISPAKNVLTNHRRLAIIMMEMGLLEHGILGDFPYAIWEHDSLGHLCGYLGVPPAHPWYGLMVSDTATDDIRVHGGITYSEPSQLAHPEFVRKLTAHIESLKAAEPIDLGVGVIDLGDWTLYWERKLDFELRSAGSDRDFPIDLGIDVWWLGFDCGHYLDVSPGLVKKLKEMEIEYPFTPGATFKDRDYVYEECKHLASQAANAWSASRAGD